MRAFVRAARSACRRRIIATGTLAVAAIGCTHNVRVATGESITFGALTFAPPPGTGWMQLQRSAEHVVFGRHEAALGGPVPGETTRGEAATGRPQPPGFPAVNLTAWVKVVHADRPVNGYAALHAIVVRMTDQIDRNRFELHRHVVEPIDTPETMCVRRSMLLDDLRGATSTPGRAGTAAAPMVMRMVDTLCRDPLRPATVYAIHVSERAARLRPFDIAGNLAEQWLGLMRFATAPERAP